ncbi:YobI family P-loop NTPase [Sediminibacterium roseum]|nr:hypothetical protein [Sediminibacterium roseum]
MKIPKMALSALNRLIAGLQNLQTKWNVSARPELPYAPLSASDTAENVDEYLQAIDWAIEHRKKYGIYNIALTGPYGSGKSSILKTYMKSRKGKGNTFLPISLATFQEEKAQENPATPPVKNELLRLIELSILQQIFYHENDRKIPDSRFRKIKSFSFWQLLLTTVCLLLFALACLELFFPAIVASGLLLKKDYKVPDAIHWTSIVIFILGLLLIIYRSIRLISGISIEKLKIHNAEINIDKNISKSILNHHLDEILYFFEVTKYNVVVIEDLDRFRETDIFTKLREINLLINNSEKIKREIVFIYAVRDDMFREDNERTKFFEFIIPIIPIINPNNSSQKLLAKASTAQYKLSENLIDSVSGFIDDMRLLHNITNEFFLYRLKINQSLTQDNLLALIVYKNLFPNDFAQLSNNKGNLYKVFGETKKELQEDQIKNLKEAVEKAKQRIGELESIMLDDLTELRYTYLLLYVSKLKGFVSFVINGTDVTMEDMAEDANFQRLMKDECSYTYFVEYQYSYRRTEKIPNKFKQIEEEVNKSKKYLDREKDLKDISNGGIEALKRSIAENGKKIDAVRRLKLRELVVNSRHIFSFENEKQAALVNLLIRNGFIDENYNEYISLFYEGTITKSDYQFLVNIKTGVDTPFDYSLSKTKNLIRKINICDFETTFVLNYQLADSLLSVKAFGDKLDILLSSLASESATSVRFIDGYLDNGSEPGKLIALLLKKWKGCWTYLENKSQYTEDRKKKYFQLIIAHADLSDIKLLYDQELFSKALYAYPDFLSIVDNPDRIKAVIKLLNLRFTHLDIKLSPKELITFIYENNYYELNPKMIALVLDARGAYEELGFTTRNYHFIRNSGASSLIEYVKANLDSYLSATYLELENNTEEVEADLISLLNEPSIAESYLVEILEMTSTKISDLQSIQTPETKLLVVNSNKMLPTWANVFDYYQADGSTSVDPLAEYISIGENAEALAKTKIPQDSGEERTYRDFIVKLLLCDEIEDDAYDKILAAVAYSFSSLTIENLTSKKVKSLVEHRKLSFNQANFDALKENGSNHIRFIEQYRTKFLLDISAVSIDAGDLNLVIKSGAFSDAEKNLITEKCDEALLKQNGSSLEEVGKMILRNNTYRVSDSLVEAILLNLRLSVEQRIRIFKWKQSQVPDNNIDQLLNGLDEPYSDITIKGKRPLLPMTEYNSELASILKSRNYISSFDIKDNGVRINTFTT